MDAEKIVVFKSKEIRRQLHGGEWWFVINDVVRALTDSPDPSDYMKKMKKRDAEFASIYDVLEGGGQFVPPLMLPFDTPGGKQNMKCWNTEGIFRMVQSIPSPKAEPFKRWLAKTGYERIQEIENPEQGGDIAGGARKNLEKETSKSVVSKQNYKDTLEIDSRNLK